jgi:hypothetical protein
MEGSKVVNPDTKILSPAHYCAIGERHSMVLV